MGASPHHEHFAMNDSSYQPGKNTPMRTRFRGFLPVVVDVETGGFNSKTDALLEVAVSIIAMDENGKVYPEPTISTHVIPFEGANMDPKSMEINGIDPYHPLRAAREERDALGYLFKPIRQAVKNAGCTRAILVGHNAFFDLSFINACVERTGIKRNPFHPFSNFDTVTLCGLAYGQTVLARAAQQAGLPWDQSEAHSAVYDTQMTAELFCKVINQWEAANGAPV
jgi:ribonuclease T